MPRGLPWLAGASKPAKEGSENAIPKKRGRRAISDQKAILDTEIIRTAKIARRTIDSNDSSSPPPAPPEEEFMIDGADADDGWRLVEDELWSSAILFTRHLHHAEYQRQKQLARYRNESTVQTIIQPEAGRTWSNFESTKRLVHNSDRAKGRTTIEVSDDEDDPWLRDPRLARLMSQKDRSAAPKKILCARSTSRAAKGLTQGKLSPMKIRSRTSLRSSQCEESQIKTQDNISSEYDNDDIDASSFRGPDMHGVSSPENLAELKMQNIKARTSNQTRKVSHAQISSTHSSTLNDSEKSSRDEIYNILPRRDRLSSNPKIVAQVGSNVKGDEKEPNRKASVNADEIPTFLV
ncbi:uncharacterized protein PV09_02308 [Verruconis gallopava]|uniref:Uncharacterized protein n=1 Tax=Verruconis gallopava TaxID=253628 RepID=A0A0D1Z0U8_9PEZI|nr:uncharacterized protein PV09_02308 [Verruconis gallopava]KIW06592.1 hypothetical protein PV09_02308 [Verruconis gallopava]